MRHLRSMLNAFSEFESHLNLAFFFSRRVSGLAIVARSLMKRPYYRTNPRKLFISFTDLGVGQFFTQSILFLSGKTPFAVMRKPK